MGNMFSSRAHKEEEEEDQLSPEMIATVGQFLPRKELTGMCITNQQWASSLLAYSSLFSQRRVISLLSIGWVNDADPENIPDPVNRLCKKWAQVKRFKGCCRHIEAQATGLVGQRFTAVLHPETVVVMIVIPSDKSEALYLSFLNEIPNATVAFNILHFIEHCRNNIALQDALYSTDLMGSSLHSVISQRLFPTRSLTLNQVFRENAPFAAGAVLPMPTLEVLRRTCETKTICWIATGEPPTSEQVEMVLGEFAIGKSRGGDSYKCLCLQFQTAVSASQCSNYLQTVTQFFFSRVEAELVPQVKLEFVEPVKCWPIRFFADKELIKTDEVVPPQEGDQIFKKVDFTYAFTETSPQGDELNFKVIVHTERFSHNVIKGVTYDMAED